MGMVYDTNQAKAETLSLTEQFGSRSCSDSTLSADTLQRRIQFEQSLTATSPAPLIWSALHTVTELALAFFDTPTEERRQEPDKPTPSFLDTCSIEAKKGTTVRTAHYYRPG